VRLSDSLGASTHELRNEFDSAARAPLERAESAEVLRTGRTAPVPGRERDSGESEGEQSADGR